MIGALVVDAADPNCLEQLEIAERTLEAIGAIATPRQILLNKIDRADATTRRRLGNALPDALPVSTLRAEDVARVRRSITAQLRRFGA